MLDGEELRRQLLALVLAAVLVWHTFIVPAHMFTRSAGGMSPEDEGLDGEVRGEGFAVRSQRDDSNLKDEPSLKNESNFKRESNVKNESSLIRSSRLRNESSLKDEAKSIDELDWPEFIYPFGD